MVARPVEGFQVPPDVWLLDDVVERICAIVRQPLMKHDEALAMTADMFAGGVLRAAHVHELTRALSIDKRFKEIVHEKGRARVLHKVLFSLGGADPLKHVEPAVDDDRDGQKWASNLFCSAKKASEAFYHQCRRLRANRNGDALDEMMSAPYDFMPLQHPHQRAKRPDIRGWL